MKVWESGDTFSWIPYNITKLKYTITQKILGICNHTVDKVVVQDKTFKYHHLYTLPVLPGASGSAVFNNKGEVCGNINISYQKLGLSLGATSKIISSSYYNFLQTRQGSSYVLSK